MTNVLRIRGTDASADHFGIEGLLQIPASKLDALESLARKGKIDLDGASEVPFCKSLQANRADVATLLLQRPNKKESRSADPSGFPST